MQDMYTLYRSAAATAGALGFLLVPICDARMQSRPPPHARAHNSSTGDRVSCQRPPDRAVSGLMEAVRYLIVCALALQAAPQQRRRAPRAPTTPRSARPRAWWRRPRRRPCRSPRRSRRPSRWRSRRRRRSPSSSSCRKQRYAATPVIHLSMLSNRAAIQQNCWESSLQPARHSWSAALIVETSADASCRPECEANAMSVPRVADAETRQGGDQGGGQGQGQHHDEEGEAADVTPPVPAHGLGQAAPARLALPRMQQWRSNSVSDNPCLSTLSTTSQPRNTRARLCALPRAPGLRQARPRRW